MTNVTPLHRSPFYRLNDDDTIEPVLMSEFTSLTEGLNRVITKTTVTHDGAQMLVSTIFLGIDTDSNDTPVLFETMIFGGQLSGSTWRYDSLIKAKQGHADVVTALIDELNTTSDNKRVSHEHIYQR